MSVTVKNKMPAFKISAYRVLDDALKEGARDILIKSRNRVPFNKSSLQTDSDIKKNGQLSMRISYYKKYARFQEFGGDGKRVVRKYTTPGTGKAYLKTSGDEVAKRMNYIFKKHGGRARA